MYYAMIDFKKFDFHLILFSYSSYANYSHYSINVPYVGQETTLYK